MFSRSFWSFPKGSFGKSSGMNDLRTVELAADEEPDNPRKQAALYRVCFSCYISSEFYFFQILIETDELETIIRRFEDAKYSRDTECMIHYLCALYSTSQLERAAKFILHSGPSSVGDGVKFDGSIPASSFVLGTKGRPLHVVNEGSNGSGSGSWGRKFTTAVNVAIVGAILYSLFSMNEAKLGGMQSKLIELIE